MKVSITKEELTNALSVVSKGMSSRSTLPILSGILLSTAEKEIVFQTTDLEISVKCKAAAFIEEEGQTVVPGKLFSDIVKSLPEAAIQLSLKNDQILIECMNSRFTLNTLNPEDFPRFPEIQENQRIEFPSDLLATMVRQVSKSISKDETRAVLTGIFLTVTDEKIRLVATDSYRLAISEESLENPARADIEIIIPGKTFDEVVRSAGGNELISLATSDNQIIFEFGSTIFVTRKIEGNYPNYRQLIPVEKETSVIISTSAITAAVKRIALLAQNSNPIKFIFNVEDQVVEILSQAQDVGLAKEVIVAEIIGNTTEIGFNHQYIIDGLNSIQTENTVIEVQSSLKPGIFKTEGDGKFLYLAMPVRLS